MSMGFLSILITIMLNEKIALRRSFFVSFLNVNLAFDATVGKEKIDSLHRPTPKENAVVNLHKTKRRFFCDCDKKEWKLFTFQNACDIITMYFYIHIIRKEKHHETHIQTRFVHALRDLDVA